MILSQKNNCATKFGELKAIELIAEKRQADKNREIKKFEAEDILVLNGRFGAYITHAGENYKLPKGTVAEDLTLEQCQEIIANEANKSKGGAKKKTARTKKK